MDEFLKYFEDKKFVNWVINPSKELDEFWHGYIEKNKSEREHIRLARLLISHLQSKPEQELNTTSIEIFSSLIQQLENRNKKSKRKKLFFSVSKYAAIGLLCFSLGMVFYYYQRPEKIIGLNETAIMENGPQHSKLILSDGNNVVIQEKKSEIEYQADGQIVINKRDTIKTNKNIPGKILNELFVPYGKNSSIKLPDGTLAYLNAGSKLLYPSKFEGKKRVVYLVGEGFFEVTHNTAMPFIVKTNHMEVEVLGTRFDISAYPSDKFIETVLVDGKIRIREPGFHPAKESYFLKPNQKAVFDPETRETQIAHVNAANYVSWHEGFLILDTQELNRVIRKLERFYNISIKLEDPTLGMVRISGKLELKEETKKVLNILAKTASVELVQINHSKYVLK